MGTMNKNKGHSLMKWWRTKFQNGYKHIDELSSNCRSDTETLRGDEFILTPSGASLHTVEGHAEAFLGQQKVNPLVGEEVHCDLSVPANVPERREFAFTLYDFDRSGGVTKDDITGLVQAIFETLGSTLHQSSSGCRTIKVNLTLQPDTENNECKIESVGKHYEEYPTIQSNDQSHDLILESSLSSPKIRDEMYSPSTRRRRKGKMSLRRQELLQIVRANMERNNLFYPPIQAQQCGGRKRRRKHHCRCYDQASPVRRNKLHENESPPDASRFHCDCCSKKPHTTPASPHSGSYPQYNRSPITHQHSHHYQLSNKYDKRQHHLYDEQSNFTSKTVGNTPNLSRSRKKQLIQFKNSLINVDKSPPLENSLLPPQALSCGRSQHVHQHYHHHYHHPTSPVII